MSYRLAMFKLDPESLDKTEEMWNSVYDTPSLAWAQMCRVASADLDHMAVEKECGIGEKDHDEYRDAMKLYNDIVEANWITRAETWLIGSHRSYSIIHEVI
jgi:hypothetical protein